MESVLSPRCIFVPITKQGKATPNDKHHPDELIQLITFERGLGQLFEKKLNPSFRRCTVSSGIITDDAIDRRKRGLKFSKATKALTRI